MNAPAHIEHPKRIRCSALTMWPNCERCVAAKLFPELIKGKGFELRQTPIHVGAPIGTGVHGGAALDMTVKMRTGELASLREATDKAMYDLDVALEEAGEIDWKPIAAVNLDQAQKQVRRMLGVVHVHLSPKVYPKAVEDHLIADLGDGFVLTGHRDLYCIEIERDAWIIIDLKTGAVVGAHLPQIGGYSNLGRSHGNRVDGAKIFHVPRVPLKKTQPDPMIVNVPIETAERAAERICKRIKESVTEFIKSGDHHTFMANPMSKLCNDRCPAWGTYFCREHLEIDL